MKAQFPRSRIRFLSAQEQGSAVDDQLRPHYVDAIDGVPLATYKFFPSFEPERILIFYHDAGIYQCSHYHELASSLSQKYNMGVYLAELRGHGFSGGRADKLASGEVLLDDIEQVVRWVASKHMKAKIYLGAHSQTCSLLAHFGALRHPAPLSGFVMVAPYFGPFSTPTLLHMKKGRVKTPLSHTKWSAWLIHYLSNGNWGKGQPVWQFDPSPLISVRDPKRVSRYSSEMARFMNVLSPKELLAKTPIPFFAIIPTREDRFEVERMLKEIQQAAAKVPRAEVTVSSDSDFVSILSQAAAFISKQTTMQTAMA